jgi:GTP-binding protein Era
MEGTTAHRSGFVAVLGRPNVGKSTLTNRLVGQKIAITSSKPQTTRVNQLGIVTLPHAQIVLVDTPGMHEPAHALGRHMVHEAEAALEDADVVLMLADLSREPNDEDARVAAAARKASGSRRVLGLNKADLVPESDIEERSAPYRAMAPWDAWFTFSAATGAGCDRLLDGLVAMMPESPPFYPEEQVTETHERDIAAELVREQVLAHTREEVPHAVAVVVDEFRERDDGHLFVAATIYVERESQKGIVIGRGGSMLKTIGTAARREIEELTDAPVFLDLHVKVRKDWRKKDPSLRQMGYKRG